jgi:hypothetical protein
VAGEEQCDRLVAELFVGHAAAVFVLRGEQRAEEIVANVSVAPPRDDTVDELIEVRDRALHPQVARRRHPWGQADERLRAVGEELVEDCHRRFDGLPVLRVDARPEEHVGDHLHRDARRLLVEVLDFAVTPGREAIAGHPDHGVGVSLDTLGDERLRDEPPLPLPQIAVARQEPQPERPLEDVGVSVAPHDTGVLHQHRLDVIGVADHVPGLAEQANHRNVPVPIAHFAKEVELVGREADQVAEAEEAGRTRGTLGSCVGDVHRLFLSGRATRCSSSTIVAAASRAFSGVISFQRSASHLSPASSIDSATCTIRSAGTSARTAPTARP